MKHLIERSWYAVLETFILLAAFHQELSLSFVTTISMLFLVKSFHWLAEDRVEYVSAPPLLHQPGVCIQVFSGITPHPSLSCLLWHHAAPSSELTDAFTLGYLHTYMYMVNVRKKALVTKMLNYVVKYWNMYMYTCMYMYMCM